MQFSNIDSLINRLDSIDIVVAATHLNYVNGNAVLYTTDAAKKGALSWVKPFNKPQLLHHDKLTDPVGRIIDFKVKDMADNLDEPQDYVELTARITDNDAMGKVLKGLYYTCSVGSSTTRVRCSACDQVLTEDGLCEHEKGSVTDSGDRVYWIIDEISYRENSFVNNPADPYSRIVSIDIGHGHIPYKDFLDHRDALITELEESFSMKDAKLSTEQRKKLPDSAFCGPGRSFPAHDKAHVTAGLRLLNRSNFSDATKNKIKSCLYRKGKRYGISPSNDEIQEMPNLLTYRIDNDLTDEEVATITDFFKENPDSDLPEIEKDQEDTQEDNKDEINIIEDFENVKSKPKKEVIEFTEKVLSDFEAQLQDSENKIKELTDEVGKLNETISDNETILNNKEDEISKLLDDNAVSEMAHKKALVDNIIDLKINLGCEDNREDLENKYIGRQLDSLVDTINDLRNEIVNNDEIERVDDPTLSNTETEDNTQDDAQETKVPDHVEPRYSIFYK